MAVRTSGAGAFFFWPNVLTTTLLFIVALIWYFNKPHLLMQLLKRKNLFLEALPKQLPQSTHLLFQPINRLLIRHVPVFSIGYQSVSDP
jgi:hypothetical protein